MKSFNVSKLSFILALAIGLAVAWSAVAPGELDGEHSIGGVSGCSECYGTGFCSGNPNFCQGAGSTACTRADPNSTCDLGVNICQFDCYGTAKPCVTYRPR